MTTRVRLALLVLPVALVAGLAAPAAAQTRHHHHRRHHHRGGLSGVQGTVFESCLLVPATAAAAQLPCEGSPLVATVSAQDPAGDTVADTASDDQGRFQIALDPGQYTLVTDAGSPPLNCPDTPVTVKAGQVSPVNIVCFTGGRVPPPF